MVTVRVKGGTPEESTSLCVSCTYGVVRKGYSAAEEEVFCRWTDPTTRVHFKVRECSAFSDRSSPSLYWIEKTGWVLLTKTAGRSIGFVTAQKFREIEGEDAEILPPTIRDAEQGD
jgi:hypothetical protein